MAKAKTKKALEKKNWTQNFTLVGEAKVGDFTFKIDEHSDKSDWIYNALNLGVDCGEKYGTVYCELMGGYGAGRDNVIYVHGKKDDGKDDFENSYTIDWEDRFDESVLENIGDLCFMTVGLEKDSKDKTVYSKFLSPYDVIAYVHENLTEGMVIRVKGQLKYTMYNETVQVRKEVNSIVLSKAEPKDYKAEFVQTMLIGKSAVGKANKEKHTFPITGIILEKFKEYNGNDLTENGKVKGGKFVPLRRVFEFPYNPEDGELNKKKLDMLFKVEKGYSQITYIGELIEGGAVVTATEDDLDADVKEMIEFGLMTLEDALAQCANGSSKERRMVIVRPQTKTVGEENPKLKIVRTDKAFMEEDLMLDYLQAREEEEEEEIPFEEAEEVDAEEAGYDEDDSAEEDPDAWLKELEG